MIIPGLFCSFHRGPPNNRETDGTDQIAGEEASLSDQVYFSHDFNQDRELSQQLSAAVCQSSRSLVDENAMTRVSSRCALMSSLRHVCDVFSDDKAKHTILSREVIDFVSDSGQGGGGGYAYFWKPNGRNVTSALTSIDLSYSTQAALGCFFSRFELCEKYRIIQTSLLFVAPHFVYTIKVMSHS